MSKVSIVEFKLTFMFILFPNENGSQFELYQSFMTRKNTFSYLHSCGLRKATNTCKCKTSRSAQCQ